MSQSSNKPFGRDRQAAVDNARQKWMNRLIDLSRRNNLLYWSEESSTLDFSEADPELLNALLAGDRNVAIADLFPNLQEEVVSNQVASIYEDALANAEKKNLETLCVAIGMAVWSSEKRRRAPAAPVLLVPMILDLEGGAKLRRNGEAQINPALLCYLKFKKECPITPQALLGGVESVVEGRLPNSSVIYTRFEQAAAKVPGFKIKPRAILSNFCFRKMVMVKDLDRSLERMVAHDVIAAMAGDVEARQSVRNSHVEIDARELDRIPPEQEFLVFDADSSQQSVIQAVLAGRTGVIQGPPGTGKSQTIANLIASLAARGQRVLFVAEKESALEVVNRQLEQKDLGHLVLDLYSSKASTGAVMQQFRESFETLQTTIFADSTNIHFQLRERRTKLNQYSLTDAH